MAQVTNTVSGFDNQLTRREMLADVITNTSPEETPFFSALSKSMRSTSDYCEWPEHKLRDPIDNKHIEGDQFSAVTRTTPNRLGNYHQIGRIDISVTRRADILRKAGRGRELTYQLMLAGMELKRDMNLTCQMKATKIAKTGNDTTAPETASFNAFLRTNSNEGGGGSVADAALSDDANGNGYPKTAAILGTTNTTKFDMSSFFDAKRKCYENGGNPMHLFVAPETKAAISAHLFVSSSARIATQRQDQGRTSRSSKGATVLGAVDVILTDFGPVAIIADLQCPGAPLGLAADKVAGKAAAALIDTRYAHISYITRFENVTIGKQGDSFERFILSDWAFVLRAQQTCANFQNFVVGEVQA